MLQPKGPGDCWPMKGPSGNVTIRLYAPLHVSNVTVQHVDPAINPTQVRPPGLEAHIKHGPGIFMYTPTFITH